MTYAEFLLCKLVLLTHKMYFIYKELQIGLSCSCPRWVFLGQHELPSFFSDITEFCNVFSDPKNKVHWHPTVIQCFVVRII
jgi:hypothetical protein